MRAIDPAVVREWKAAMLVAYRETGSIGESCAQVGFDRQHHTRWLSSDPMYAVAVAAITAEREAKGLKSGRATGTGRPVDESHRRQSQDLFLEAFAQIGLVIDAAKAVGVAFKQHYRWLEDPEYAQRFLVVSAEAEAAGVAKMNRPVHKSRTPEGRETHRKAANKRVAAMTPEQKERNRATLRRANAFIKGGKIITQLEADVLMELNRLRVPYLVHSPLGSYVADVYEPTRNLDIEADGEWAHGQPSKEEADAKRDVWMAEQGITVLRLSEAEIKAGDWSRLHAALGVPSP